LAGIELLPVRGVPRKPGHIYHEAAQSDVTSTNTPNLSSPSSYTYIDVGMVTMPKKGLLEVA
jgi:hypothetical protein